MSSDPNITEALGQILADGQQRRAKRAMTAFRTLRRYERRIAKEAAVMGYVLGHQAGRLDEREHRTVAEITARWPAEFAVLQSVIEHCDSTSDLYPFLSDACDGRRRRITKARLFDFERAGHAEPRTAAGHPAHTPGDSQ